MTRGNGVKVTFMKYIPFIFAFMASPAFAQIPFGGVDDGIQAPRAMMVQGSSVIDETTETVENDDDATDFSNPDTPAPAMEDIDAFEPAPAVQKPQNIRRVVKQIPAVRAQRSITDDRIDDGYVQQMIKDNLDFTGPIE